MIYMILMRDTKEMYYLIWIKVVLMNQLYSKSGNKAKLNRVCNFKNSCCYYCLCLRSILKVLTPQWHATVKRNESSFLLSFCCCCTVRVCCCWWWTEFRQSIAIGFLLNYFIVYDDLSANDTTITIYIEYKTIMFYLYGAINAAGELLC